MQSDTSKNLDTYAKLLIEKAENGENLTSAELRKLLEDSNLYLRLRNGCCYEGAIREIVLCIEEHFNTREEV